MCIKLHGNKNVIDLKQRKQFYVDFVYVWLYYINEPMVAALRWRVKIFITDCQFLLFTSRLLCRRHRFLQVFLFKIIQFKLILFCVFKICV